MSAWGVPLADGASVRGPQKRPWGWWENISDQREGKRRGMRRKAVVLPPHAPKDALNAPAWRFVMQESIRPGGARTTGIMVVLALMVIAACVIAMSVVQLVEGGSRGNGVVLGLAAVAVLVVLGGVVRWMQRNARYAGEVAEHGGLIVVDVGVSRTATGLVQRLDAAGQAHVLGLMTPEEFETQQAHVWEALVREFETLEPEAPLAVAADN